MARPTTEEVKQEIDQLSEKLGLEKIDVTDFAYADLTALVNDLRAKVKDAENPTEADKAEAEAQAKAEAEAQAKAEAEAQAKAEAEAGDEYVVAEGKSVTCAGKRIKNGGKRITVADVYDDEEAFATLIRRGFVVKK